MQHSNFLSWKDFAFDTIDAHSMEKIIYEDVAAIILHENVNESVFSFLCELRAYFVTEMGKKSACPDDENYYLSREEFCDSAENCPSVVKMFCIDFAQMATNTIVWVNTF